MRIQLARRWIDMLRKQPESGMGYQRVDVRFADGRRVENVIVFNAEHLDLPDTFDAEEITDVKLHSSTTAHR